MSKRTTCLLTLMSATWMAAIGTREIFGQSIGTESSFYPAYFQPGNPPRLRLFPPNGQTVTLNLPSELPTNARAIAFSLDGKVLYTQTDPLNRSASIYRITFQPTSESVLPGSEGIGELWCLVTSPNGTIIVAGWSWTQNTAGIFRIDPHAATMQLLPVGSASSCGGVGGVLSPDGRKAIIKVGKHLGLVTLNTGATGAIKHTSADSPCMWSPNSRSIACIHAGRLILIDADDIDRYKNLGSSGDGPLVWSPDSKYLLLRRSSLSCAASVYGESLEIVDVEAGKREIVKSSRCLITAGTIGWLDSGIVQQNENSSQATAKVVVK